MTSVTRSRVNPRNLHDRFFFLSLLNFFVHDLSIIVSCRTQACRRAYTLTWRCRILKKLFSNVQTFNVPPMWKNKLYRSSCKRNWLRTCALMPPKHTFASKLSRSWRNAIISETINCTIALNVSLPARRLQIRLFLKTRRIPNCSYDISDAEPLQLAAWLFLTLPENYIFAYATAGMKITAWFLELSISRIARSFD